MSEPAIIGETFVRRLERFHAHWISKREVWMNADALCIPFGTAPDDSVSYNKHISMHLYLLGWEFPETIMLLVGSTFFFMSSNKKCSMLEAALAPPCPSCKLEVKVIRKTKEEAENKANFAKILSAAKKVGIKLALPLKEQFPGSFIASFMSEVEQRGFEKVDVALALGVLLSVKEEDELKSLKTAAVFSNKVMKHGLVKKLEQIIDQDTATTHEELSKHVEGLLYDPSKLELKVPKHLVESCFSPIFQSGGVYDIRPSAVSDNRRLKYDVIITSLGARFKNYCASIARTFLLDPPTSVQEKYEFILQVVDKCLEQMHPGRQLKTVYEEATRMLQQRYPNLVPLMPKHLGFAVGLEYRDNQMYLNSKNTAIFEANQVFVLSVGLQDIPLTDEDKMESPAYAELSTYSLLLADTVLVQNEGPPEVLTKMDKSAENIMYSTKDAQDGNDGEEAMEVEEVGGLAVTERLRSRGDARHGNEVNVAQERMEKQAELMRRKLEEKKRKGRGDKDNSEQSQQTAEEIQAYASTEDYPSAAKPNQIYVHMEQESVIVPVFGQPVAFHISTIKNVVMPEPDKRASYLRINFYSPGQALGKDAPPNIVSLIDKHQKQMVFVKELTFRSTDSRNINQANRMLQELRKRVRARAAQEAEERDLVVQARLIKMTDKKPPRLSEVTMRPQFSGRKTIGTLEAHVNGLRFTSNKGEQLEIMYTNIKHALLQPCDKEVMVLVHFHLKNHIMVGKKKHLDVQFYTEVVEASQGLDNRRSMYDPDELEEEQKERRLRKQLNSAFQEFCKKVERVVKDNDFDIEFDIPYKELGFFGNPHKEMVHIQPTVNCLVNLTELPFFVITLHEIENVHFERVIFSHRNFDMTIIFKDFNKPPATIGAIEMNMLDAIQDWLTDMSITYTQGSKTVAWKFVMQSAREDPDFFKEVEGEYGEKLRPGWLRLQDEEVDEDEEDDDDEDEYKESAEEDSSEDDDDDEDFDDDDEDDSDEYEDEEEEEEEGQDWDELEREAKASDKLKREYEDDDGPKKKKRK